MKKVGLIGILFALICVSVAGVSAVCQQGGSCEIFVTVFAFQGDFKTEGNGANGVIGADNLCNNDVNRNTSKNYKALIGVPGLRDLTHDWPLLSNTNYTRNDGITLIKKTDDNGCVIPYNLINSVSNNELTVWTGLEGTDCSATGINCVNFTSSSPSPSLGSRYGISTSIDNHWLSNPGGIAYCQNNFWLYCVEQPTGGEPQESIPEFSTTAIIAVIAIIAIAGFFFVRKK